MDQAQPEAAARPPGFMDHLRGLGASLHDVIHVRAELFALELGEEADRRTRMLVLGVVAALFLALFLALAAFLVVIVFWDTHRIAAALGVTVLYGAIAAWAYGTLRGAITSGPPPFQETLAELRKDLDALKAGHE